MLGSVWRVGSFGPPSGNPARYWRRRWDDPSAAVARPRAGVRLGTPAFTGPPSSAGRSHRSISGGGARLRHGRFRVRTARAGHPIPDAFVSRSGPRAACARYATARSAHPQHLMRAQGNNQEVQMHEADQSGAGLMKGSH